MTDESAIYEEHILRHNEEPYHNATFADATQRKHVDNPICGDSVQLELQVSATGMIEQAWFTGAGCVISQASASMLVEHIEGQTLEVRCPCGGAANSQGGKLISTSRGGGWPVSTR